MRHSKKYEVSVVTFGGILQTFTIFVFDYVTQWYISYDAISQVCDVLKPLHLQSSSMKDEKDRFRILDIGCGNSSLGLEIYEASKGKAEVVSIDFSDTCIDIMKSRYPHRADAYIQMDVRDMEFGDSDFDIVTDKGTLDAMMAQGAAQGERSAMKCLMEISRVLKTQGARKQLGSYENRLEKGIFLLVTCRPWKKWQVELPRWPSSLHHVSGKKIFICCVALPSKGLLTDHFLYQLEVQLSVPTDVGTNIKVFLHTFRCSKT